jgi:cell division protein FtsB
MYSLINSSKAIYFVLGFLFVMLFLFIPKIWLRANIYYISKDINRYYSKYVSLKEENRFLKQQLEKMKFKNTISNPLLLEHQK